MKCPACVKEGEKSKVFVGASFTTLMATYSYYDEEGKFCHHDPNVTTTDYACSRGHRWQEKSGGKPEIAESPRG